MNDKIYSEILHLRLDNEFLSLLKEFLSKVEHSISWQEFGRIPFTTSNPSLRVFLEGSLQCQGEQRYTYLSYSPHKLSP